MSTTSSELKTVGKRGPDLVGESFAGKTLWLEHQKDGSILLIPVTIIPESQIWTLQEPHRSAVERGMTWAGENPPAETNLELLAKGGRQP